MLTPSQIKVASAGVEVTYNWPPRKVLRSSRQAESISPAISVAASNVKLNLRIGILIFRLDSRFRGNDKTARVIVIPDPIGNPENL
jgi:hypothetical protein